MRAKRAKLLRRQAAEMATESGRPWKYYLPTKKSSVRLGLCGAVLYRKAKRSRVKRIF